MTTETDNAAFSWPVRVYYEDTDAQGLVYFANYFKFMERARTEWVRSLGIEQDRLLEEERRCFVVASTDAQFIRPARFNDQLQVTVRMLRRTRVSFLIEQDIFRDDELLCSGTVKVAYIDSDTHRPARLPQMLSEGRET
jgi:acyl-CoA thioester hydrolase